jgi:hypothetical protein
MGTEKVKRDIPPDPERLKMKRILKSQKDGKGWLWELECKHAVWSAIDRPVLSKTYCGACVHDFLNEVRLVQADGMETRLGKK